MEKKRAMEKSQPYYERLYKVGRNPNAKHMQEFAEKDVPQDDISRRSSQFIGPLSSKILSNTHSRKTSYSNTPEPNFKPNITKKSQNQVRTERVESLLYKDALRR
mmetsp:Transcript_30765/g.27980  ORF Transcript_30765/g.27980 Transcript_30765/m.27980 type:complete len:105 (+) Transcript_30765:770-1084(+)